jgi:hypothetical protein
LVGVPIVLHLIMRREAKQFQFPALRFVERRRTLNQHRLRLRHLLLLALRCAIIALLAAALARPTLRGAGALGKEDAPIATVLVFDNSLRMQYQHENQTRLERAKELALWLIGQLPADAPITVIDRAGRQRGQDLDRDAAELRVERLELSSVVRSPEEPLRDAADWLEKQKDHRGEVYVFTDLAAEAWPEEALIGLGRRLEELPGTSVYVIDVGIERPRNAGIDALRLSSEQLGPGGTLQIGAQLIKTESPAMPGAASAAGAADVIYDEVVVEVYLGEGPGDMVKRGQKVVTAAPTGPAPFEFSLSQMELGVHQGFVRIVGNDALPCDDIRYFTVEVRPPKNVLLLGEAASDTVYLREALAPSAAIGVVQSKFVCKEERYAQLDKLDLSAFDAVCLADPPTLPSGAWQALANFVEAGGGIGVFLGRRAESDGMNGADAQRLLPARLRWRSRDQTFLRPVAVEHPALAELRDLVDIAPWSEFPVFQYWELEGGTEEAYLVAPFANGKPALVERRFGRGRVLLMTTSVSEPAHSDPWNLLATGTEPWPFLALTNGIVQYLCGTSNERLNYVAGQTAVLPLPSSTQIASYVLQMPGTSDGTARPAAVRQSLTPGQPDLSITSTDSLGNYRVQAGGREGGLDRGFSVNCDPQMSRLERTTPERIAGALGEDRVRWARTQEEIEVRIGQGRIGRELFPVLILIVAAVVGAEHLLANRFYVSKGE